MSFELKIQKYIYEQQLVEKGDRLLIACSGGMDSMGLVHFFKKFQHIFEIRLFVAHVDHMLRGETSLEDRRFVEQYCHHHNIPVFSTSIPIPQLLREEGGNSQALCRRERYAYFEEMMEKYDIDKLVTAHHADDQLESILMALTKAGTISGMKGIYAKRKFSNGTIIRPFLTVTKVEIREYLEENEGSFREDASNLKDDYTRNRFRHHVVPLLKSENRNISSHAVQFAEQLQQDDDLLKTMALERFPHIVIKNGKQSYTLKIPLFQKEPVALQRRIILILLNYLYNSYKFIQSHTLISSILNLCGTIHGSASLHLPEKFIAKRNYDEVKFEKLTDSGYENLPQQTLLVEEWTQLQNGIRLYIGEASNVVHTFGQELGKYYFNSNMVTMPISIRTRASGDRILLKGMENPKRLSRLFIDEKVPLDERERWPIVVDAKDQVLAVIGLRVNKSLSTIKQANDDKVLIIARENSNDL
ncbi:tRNA lysidine(34) synthetase TilS [Lysinibacillus sp. SGAir0095]|uniref:tRNA lysidine(34) synthetase TilS n=1 Tax=Lysinibacillus sp. SGAir0095 TaxID=2070463 RepID=UPI0010CD349B|nr:tRNA lysidine(34) synthetase TilS [Lysinibacillus sp. SGAir0095]QCR30769.1 tRNA lysidine(34) synthetase TilS [Lysinibacillus sp. SGAir0095]